MAFLQVLRRSEVKRLPKSSFLPDLTSQSRATFPGDLCVSLQGFEGTLVWESLDSAGLSTVDSSSVQLSDGGGVLKISSVRRDAAERKKR